MHYTLTVYILYSHRHACGQCACLCVCVFYGELVRVCVCLGMLSVCVEFDSQCLEIS